MHEGKKSADLEHLTAELAIAQERAAATQDILHIISQSRDDEAPVFQAILHRAEQLCHAVGSGLHLLNDAGTHLQMCAMAGRDHGSFPVGTEFDVNGPFGQSVCVREKRVVHIEDLKDTDLYRDGHEGRRALVDVEGTRTHLHVPLIIGDTAVGNITLGRREPSPFTPDEIALVETFASQAVIAIENVRQFKALQTVNAKLQDRLRREAATGEVLHIISQSRDDQKPVLDAIVSNAASLCEAGTVGLSLVNDDGTRLQYTSVWGRHYEFFHEGFEFDLSGPLQVSRTVREARTIHTHDLADDPLYRDRDPIRVRMVEVVGARTFLTVPLLKDGAAIGCLNLTRREVLPFDPDDIALLEAFASQAVIAIENVRQFRALETLNAELGDRVRRQVDEIERMGRLKRFLPAAVADTVISSGSEKMLSSHRALLGVLFCDIRGFTAFCETAEPEETIEVLQTYHEEMGRLINAQGAGVDHRMGDGIMVLFNDPLPCDDPAGDALRLAIAMRQRMAELCREWRRLGHRLGFGVGVSLGYATVGMVGFEGRFDYTASGTAINLGARLCDEAADGEILLSPRAAIAVEQDFEIESRGEVTFKGIREPTEVFRLAAGPPA